MPSCTTSQAVLREFRDSFQSSIELCRIQSFSERPAFLTCHTAADRATKTRGFLDVMLSSHLGSRSEALRSGSKVAWVLKSVDRPIARLLVAVVERTTGTSRKRCLKSLVRWGIKGVGDLIWLRYVLDITERPTSQIIVSFHSMGADDLGLMAILAWINIVGP